MPLSERPYAEFLPEEVWKWKLMEERFDRVLKLHNYQEIRLPILQNRDLVHKGITALMPGREAARLAAKPWTSAAMTAVRAT
ncbi:MAG TPA: ATP phosphoribosyltransferase regulatory subunit [Candidatus Syntrophosphaera sp.]|nr:ATP phosphoribosyltransferase regulatory subunit [Candidatus Syntrophosphaera sp.]